MRRIIVLLFLLLVASCSTILRDSDDANQSERCYQMHGNSTFKNDGNDISIYLGRVKSKGGRSWESTPYHPFEISETSFVPSVGYAAGFGFSVPSVEEVMVSLNGMPPVRYRCLKLDYPDYELFTLEAKEEFWVPPTFPRDGFCVPELPQGEYFIEVRYRIKGRELWARWHLTYRPSGNHRPPPMPTCSNEAQDAVFLLSQNSHAFESIHG